MEEYRVLVAEGIDDVLNAIAADLRCHYRVRATNNGRRALEMMEEDCPDILVLDLELPELDGFALLQDAAVRGLHPVTLALTRLRNDYILDMAAALDIQYIIVKPCPVRAVTQRVANLLQWQEKRRASSLQRITAESLAQFEIRQALNGYHYLDAAIQMVAENPRRYITKEVYPEIARQQGCSAQCVEHSIRTAIEGAWKSGRRKQWQEHFPNDTARPPSNKRFVTYLGRLVCQQWNMWQGR